MAFSTRLAADTGKAPPQTQEPRTETGQEPGNPLWSQVATATPDAGVADAAPDAAAAPDAGAATDAGPAAGTGPAAPVGADSCATPEEEKRKKLFRFKVFSRTPFQPSTGLGLFDVWYWPVASLMAAVARMAFRFVPADDTPGPLTLAFMRARGQDISRFFWSDGEKARFRQDYVRRVMTRWSLRHRFVSKKPCWPFAANPVIRPLVVDKPKDAHWKIQVHKSSGPGIDYKSALTHPASASGKGSGDLWQSDLREAPDFWSGNVATNERRRLERALTASGANPVLFGKNDATVRPVERARLGAFAAALKGKNPSAPDIPVNLAGHASSEGDPARNMTLSLDRAVAVRDYLNSQGISQPALPIGRGPGGAPNDAANRRVDISVDRTFEATYKTNRYSVGEHEFGHVLGLPDEYQNNTTGALGSAQTAYDNLARAAGVSPVDRWGEDTSSVMSVGVDVLPRHYLTLWEALGTMTTPDINQNEWQIS